MIAGLLNSVYLRTLGILVLFLALSVYLQQYLEGVNEGVSLLNGLFFSYWGNTFIECFLLVTGGILIIIVADNGLRFFQTYGNPILEIGKEYGLILVCALVGICFLINMSDFISLYIAIEFQSFAVYILASFYKSSESATSAGLKYFLLGAMSSAFILLGLMNLESLIALVTTDTQESTMEVRVLFGLFFVIVGLLFKIAAAPFHQWAPDVYNGVPTIVTTWLTIIPKISILIVLLTLSVLANNIIISNT